MTPTKTATILRRLADEWRHEESQLCKQFGDVIVQRSMRARRIKDTDAIDAAVEMIDRLEAAEKERDALRAKVETMERQEPVGVLHVGSYYGEELQDWEFEADQRVCDRLNERHVTNPTSLKLYALPGAQPAQSVPEVTDAMALAFHYALTDGSIGESEVEEIKKGLRAALASSPEAKP